MKCLFPYFLFVDYLFYLSPSFICMLRNWLIKQYRCYKTARHIFAQYLRDHFELLLQKTPKFHHEIISTSNGLQIKMSSSLLPAVNLWGQRYSILMSKSISSRLTGFSYYILLKSNQLVFCILMLSLTLKCSLVYIYMPILQIRIKYNLGSNVKIISLKT